MRRFASLVTSLALAAGALLSLPVAVQAKAAYDYDGHVYYLAVGDGEGSGTWDGASCSNPTYYTNDVNEGEGADTRDAVQHVVDLAGDSAADTLFLCAGTYTLAGDVEISDDLWVAGAGAVKTIVKSDGGDHDAFASDSVDIHFTQLTISGFSSSTGGALGIERADLRLDGVVMQNNHASGWGGAIDWYNPDSSNNLTITNSKFLSNTAGGVGGAIRIYSPFNTSIVSVTSSTFVGNTSSNDGGVIHQEGGDLTIDLSTFSKNTSTDWGGVARYTGDELTVNRSTFFQNSADNGGAFGLADWNYATFYKDTFTKNAADGNGGANGGAIDNWSDADMSVSYSSFTGNTAGYGAAICNCGTGDLYSWNNTYSSNRVTNEGGAIYANNYFESTNDRFTSNVAEAAIGGGGGKGAAVLVDGNADIARAVFQGNSGGSTLEVWNYLDLIRSSFKGNKNLRPRGSMIWTDYFSVLSVRENTFSGNIAPDGALFGACQSVDRTFAANNVIGKNSALWISLPVTQIIQNEWCD